MEKIQQNQQLELQVVVTGTHLTAVYGYTYREVEESGFRINKKVEMLLSANTRTGVAKSTGLGMISFADAFEDLSPDLVVLLGDRFEIFSAASAAMLLAIPIAHIHGGESTEGAYDEAIRHSITKMAHLHFVAAEEYRARVIQLGEDPKRVFNVGSMAADAIKHMPLLSKHELEESLQLRFDKRSLLITFHPVTLAGEDESEREMHELLKALDTLDDTTLIFTMPNADNGSSRLSRIVSQFVKTRINAHSFTSLGQLRYLSCMAVVDGVVGNSSSGMIEAPILRTGTINIGSRQKGRITTESIINCEATAYKIETALKILLSDDFRKNLTQPHSDDLHNGGSSEIVEVLASLPSDIRLKKQFFDMR